MPTTMGIGKKPSSIGGRGQRDDPNRGRALRYIGWEVYASEVGEPRKALHYVNRCALENPLDGNTWQDLGRTYAAVIGIDL